MKKDIDYQKVKDFFAGVATHSHCSDLTLAATSCPDNPPGFLLYRDKSHKKHFFKALKINKQWTVLDLGCGTGRWTFAFAKRARFVVGVDNSQALLKLAEQEAKNRSIFNVKFINSSLFDFFYPEKFDLIFFSGVLLYIKDDDLSRVISNIKNLLKPEGKVALLESISIEDKIVKDSVYDERLQTTYSAIYRRPEEYKHLFTRYGFKIEYENDTLARNLSIFIYNHFVPTFLKKHKPIIALLKLGLSIQTYLDPYLLKFNMFRNRAETHQKFFIFKGR